MDVKKEITIPTKGGIHTAVSTPETGKIIIVPKTGNYTSSSEILGSHVQDRPNATVQFFSRSRSLS